MKLWPLLIDQQEKSWMAGKIVVNYFCIAVGDFETYLLNGFENCLNTFFVFKHLASEAIKRECLK